jgi:hypothetical protein
MLLTFRQRGWELGTAGRWLAAIGLGIAALAACIAASDAWLPWDIDTNVLAGCTAGVVVGAFLALWAASAIERSAAGDEAPGGGHTIIKNQTIYTYSTTPLPVVPLPARPPRNGVVPPKP